MKKYKIVKADTYNHLYRIKALRDFGDVKAGDLGGWVGGYDNLSQDGNCWIYNDAIVSNDARISDNAKVYGNAIVSDRAKIYGDACVYDNAVVAHEALVYGKAVVRNKATINGFAKVFGYARVLDYAIIGSHAEVYDVATICNNAYVAGSAKVYARSIIHDFAKIYDEAEISACTIGGNCIVHDRAHIAGVTIHYSVKICGDVVIRDITDFLIVKNNWSSGRNVLWTRSDDMYSTGCFRGTAEELLAEAKTYGESKYRKYKALVDFVENLKNIE